MRKIRIFDTTLRDGEQSPGVSLNPQEKLEIAKQLAQLNVDVIEAGFPIASPGDAEGVKLIAQQIKGPAICALARCKEKDIEVAGEALEHAERPLIHVFLATSDIHLQHKLHLTREEALEEAVRAVKKARNYTDEVEFSAEDATRSDWEYLSQIYAAVIKAGATVLNIPDTVGYTIPEEMKELIIYLLEHTPGMDKVEISVHCHNDLGLATANSLAAISAGATQIECTINGIGERAGNAALEEIAMALHVRKDRFQARTSLNLQEIYRTSRLVSRLTGMLVQPNKAIVGQNAFAHEAGIHQDGVLKDKLTYEIMDAQLIGREERVLVLGKHSGRHAFAKKLEELGYQLSEEELNQAFQRFKQLADQKKEITEADLKAIVSDEVSRSEDIYRLDFVHVCSGNNILPTATVRLIREGGEILEGVSTGVGPVDAAYKAISKMLDISPNLVNYTLQSITGGTEALGEVIVRIIGEDQEYVGRGSNQDVVVASVLAYLAAINRMAQKKKKINPQKDYKEN
ncbi:MAG TPA: 2-isopropylmalate synthase [Candidatus Atribacteria bacterium]|mgnify:FL=1|jgi:2-isopropylmalate synthase|uniref:2-isopropylmalate synthase n=1 Tax=Candidatus Sordicultor fermentans TaxID=1953203 RepID=UPI0016940718|nr:2-isopropylmalate synthase [Atribacterota bacterium]NLY05013.1 2-isopropylmalate synthase [Candidatus Atribacteria bacterium]MDI9607968.1 2-isopropylmalate synthase [Atribacterota bacterium]HOA99217.1 2-isopropylmalate synthase [Candidatus Atribacteria bacterium]HPT63976.1 2-isopropylmalate synthase [Candidatus Atribacteria bacterium]